jgi:hypothetical protein
MFMLAGTMIDGQTNVHPWGKGIGVITLPFTCRCLFVVIHDAREKITKKGRNDICLRHRRYRKRSDPQVLAGLKDEAQQRDIGYQTLINNILTEHAKKKTA